MASNYFVQQPLMMLSERAVQTIRELTLGLLRREGIRVASEEALELLSDYGVRCDRAAMRAYPDEDSVQKALGTVQKQYTLYGRHAHTGRTLTSFVTAGMAGFELADYGQCVIDETICDYVNAFTVGIDLAELDQALAAVDDVVRLPEHAGTYFLGHPHTAAHGRDRSYRLEVFAVGSLTRTLAAGEKTVYQKARERAESLLGEHGLLAPPDLRQELPRIAGSGHQP